MKKIPTLFLRDWEGDRRFVTREVNPECSWVIAGEGAPSRKYDGTCVMFDGDRWWARREVKAGKAAPAGFVEVSHDDETGKTVGWEPVEQSGFAKLHAQSVADIERDAAGWLPGTYELCGPKVNGNPEGYGTHRLIRHAEAERLDDAPRDFDGLAAWLHSRPYEGVVWHHDGDGRMAKIKKRDFRAP